ncbi:beta-galactosidase [Amylibacter sp.]|nr:beta-galactosidase [Amylibacter sp.]MDA9290889.1 beta-galactosidase [Amylibacter sp.]MDA9301636.1 beta-galactosidase [Amylibacter sp.]MDB0015760.1 beta-galactosidase [Amylibacter sp.]MDB4221466.1 beta-galactosidase [Amylibacter sp.]
MLKPKLGTCYYPEHWSRDIWKSDVIRMVELGLSWVRIGEFSWSKIEPKEGELDWEWLDCIVELLRSHKLDIIMGTPTATPPKWVLDKYPDMLAIDELGNVRGFGSRRHYCFSHLGYRKEAERITREMVSRYGLKVQAWQVDNEYGCHDTTLSYSQAALEGFRDWLSQKYQSPSALNKAWGNIFWSMEINEFSDIELPNLTVTEPNPAHVMDFRRYTSDQVVKFNNSQVTVLRKFSKAPLIHNYMGRITAFDHYEVGDDLDIASWDSYPLGFLEMVSDADEKFKAKYAHQGDPDFQSFHHDLYRTVGSGRWWVMEQQPGPVNWAAYNPAPLAGMVRLWSWEAIAHGAEVVCYFRWRQAPFAQEQMHAGLLRVDNVPAPAWNEISKLNSEINSLGIIEQKDAHIALIFDYQSQWAWEIQPQAADFDYFREVFDTYSCLKKLGVDVDVCSSNDPNLNKYKIIFAPSLFSTNEILENCSGHLVLGPRFNSKTTEFKIPNPLPPNVMGLDVIVERVETLRPNMSRPLKGAGSVIRWIEDISHNATVLDETKDGAPIILQQNNKTYLAACLDLTAKNKLFKKLLKDQGINYVEMPEGVRQRSTKNHKFIWNYSNKEQNIDGITLAPAEVKIISI